MAEPFSLLLTVYAGDRPDYVRDAFHSAVDAQTRRPEQVVLVQDGPVAAELDACLAEVREASPVEVTFLRLERNAGLGVALDQGLAASRYDVVARMDADDIAMPRRFGVQLPVIEEGADLVGAGMLEFGADRADSGTFELGGRPVDTGSVHAAVRAGIGMVPEERRSEGLMLDKSVAFNMNIATLRALRGVRGLPFVSGGKARSRAQRLAGQLGVKTAGVGRPIGTLSGGNQQKALIARWLTPGLKVLFLDEPSRGVDIGARQEIHQAIRDLADSGVGTVVISSDVEELVSLCDRVVVMCEGEVTGEISGDDITEDRVIELSYAHRGQGEAR